MSIAEAKQLTGLFHETQIGALCGQHVLNNLLQGPYITLDVLSEIARKLDKDEHEMLYIRPGEPYNLEAEGFCNIQVLQTILKHQDLELIPFNSRNPIAEQARREPAQVRAYICNLDEHWFAIRKFGQYYFDLNSMYTLPNLMLDETLMEEMNFIQTNGGSIFIVHGNLPDCEAEHRLNSAAFNPFKYLSIVKNLPPYAVDQSMFVSLEPPGPDGKYILRVPPIIMDEYERNPNSPSIKKNLDRIVPAHLRDRIVLARRTDNNETLLRKQTAKITMVRRLLVVRQHEGSAMGPSGHCECSSCHLSKNAARVEEAMQEYTLAMESISRATEEIMEQRREIESKMKKNRQNIEKYSKYIQLLTRIDETREKLFIDMRKLEDANTKLESCQLSHSSFCPTETTKFVLKMNDCFNDVIAAGDDLREGLACYDEAREALYQYQVEQAIEESLSSMNSTPAIESSQPSPRLAIGAPATTDLDGPLFNSESSKTIFTDSSSPIEDNSVSSLPSDISEMTVEELRILRLKKFGNRNVSLIGRIYSPNDP